MSKILQPEVMGRLAPLALNARQPMLGDVSGRHRSPVRGSSLEFAEYRNYVPGDDTRRLDWRAWARSDRDFIKEFEADTNLRMSVVLDGSGSMNYALRNPQDPVVTRMDYAKHLAAALAWMASQQGEAVGLAAIHDKKPCEVAPRRGARHLGHILEQIEDLKASDEADLPTALHHVADKLPRRSLVVVFSDLFTDLRELQPAIDHLRWRKNDVAIFHLLEPSELEFDFDKPVKLLDLEGGSPLLADPALMSDSYRQVVKEYLDNIDDMVRRSNIDYHRIRMDMTYEEALTQFLLRRM